MMWNFLVYYQNNFKSNTSLKILTEEYSQMMLVATGLSNDWLYSMIDTKSPFKRKLIKV